MALFSALHQMAASVLHHKLTHHSYCLAELAYLGHHLARSEAYLAPVFFILCVHCAIELLGGEA